MPGPGPGSTSSICPAASESRDGRVPVTVRSLRRPDHSEAGITGASVTVAWAAAAAAAAVTRVTVAGGGIQVNFYFKLKVTVRVRVRGYRHCH